MISSWIPEEASWETTEEYFPQIHFGRVIKVYDIDSPTIAAKIGTDGKLYRVPLRLIGIDSPEIRSSNPKEKALALAGREALQEKILGRMVRVDMIPKKDKFGRLLCKLWVDDECINDWALANGFAQAYDGGKKAAW